MRTRFGLLSAASAALLLLVPLASAATPTVDLGAADSFAILAGAGITNTGATSVKGDVGSHPTPTQTGFGPGADSVTITGTNHHGDAATAAAKSDLLAAYSEARDRTGGTPVVGGALGGLTLGPGLYTDDNAPDSLGLSGTLTLDGQGDPNSVFVFQSGSTLTAAAGSNVVLINGAQSCNVFWQVTSSATLGTDSHLEGTIMAQASITMATGATVDGGALAIDGAVTMDTNTVSATPCAPQGISCAPTASGVHIEWGAVEDATSYNVYRATGDQAFILLNSSAGTSYEDDTAAAGQTYTYKVTSVAAEAESADSGTCTSAAIPSFPTAAALALAAVGGLGMGALVLWRRR